jgi:hypothetical protein
VFGPIFKGVGIAASPAGRRAIRQAIRLARSAEGKKVIAQARKVAATPEGRKLIGEASKLAARVGQAAAAPGTGARVREAGRVLRGRRR